MINDAQTEQTKNISEGMKSQIGTTLKYRFDSSADGSQVRGVKSRSYYLDVIFAQIILLLLLYGISVVVIHTFK